MTSHYVMATKKLYLDGTNNDYIVLCKLGSHTISGCRVTGVGPPEPPPPPILGSKKKPGLNRVNIVNLSFSVSRKRQISGELPSIFDKNTCRLERVVENKRARIFRMIAIHYPEFIKKIILIIIHSKYFSVSDWLSITG